MSLRAQDGARPIRVALAIADPGLRQHIVRACRGLDLDLREHASGEGDVVLADRPVETAIPVIALTLGPIGENWSCDVRANVPPDIDAATLGAVIAVVSAGLTVVPRLPALASRHAEEQRNGAGAWAEGADAEETGLNDAPDPSEPPALSAREREVLTLLAGGASNKAIARALGVSVHTAKFHVASLTEKLGAKGRLEAVAIAIRSGLVMV
jgi:DNA-binding CsgD family transcriptional regulator